MRMLGGTFVYVFLCICVCVYISVFVFVFTCVYIKVCLYLYLYVFICVQGVPECIYGSRRCETLISASEESKSWQHVFDMMRFPSNMSTHLKWWKRNTCELLIAFEQEVSWQTLFVRMVTGQWSGKKQEEKFSRRCRKQAVAGSSLQVFLTPSLICAALHHNPTSPRHISLACLIIYLVWYYTVRVTISE